MLNDISIKLHFFQLKSNLDIAFNSVAGVAGYVKLVHLNSYLIQKGFLS